MNITTEYGLRIFNDTTGDYIEIRPDSDALGLIEIRSVSGSVLEARLVIDPAMAHAIAEGIAKVAELNRPKPSALERFDLAAHHAR